MLGNPKYKIGDIVTFSFGEDTITGAIYIVDRNGTYEDKSDVSYDIMTDGCLYKHVNEKYIIK